MTPRERAENCVHELGVYDASTLASATALIEEAIVAANVQALDIMERHVTLKPIASMRCVGPPCDDDDGCPVCRARDYDCEVRK